MESTALFLFKQFSACHLSNPPLRRYRSSVSPLYFALQNTGEKCTMYPYTETETPLSILSPCVSIRKYRGSARRARGLEYNDSNKIKYQSSPPAVPSSIAGRYKTIGRKGYFSTLLPCVLRSKISGRWHAVTEGLNQTIKKFLCYLFNPSSPELRSFGLSTIFYIAKHRGEGVIPTLGIPFSLYRIR